MPELFACAVSPFGMANMSASEYEPDAIRHKADPRTTQGPYPP